MENKEVEHPWEQEDGDELEEGLIARRKNLNQTTSINGHSSFSSNNGDSEGVTIGEDQIQEKEAKHYNQQNDIKVDENEKEKEKQEISEYCVYFNTDKVEANGVDSYITRHNQENKNGIYSIISNQNGDHQKHNNGSDSSLQPSEISIEELDKSFAPSVNNKTESTDIEITEFDVETVLKKQDTHDLFCPNCNSCITKRVILRKRKRRIPVLGEDAKRNKPETMVPSEVDVVSDDSSNNRAQNGADVSLDDVQPPASNEYDHQREPDVFRCLSCFSIFMPTGNGFKFFRMFGNTRAEENNQPSQKEVRVKKHWFSSIFASDTVDQLDNQDATQSLDGANNVVGSLRQDSNLRTTNSTTVLEDTHAADFVRSSSLHEPNGHILGKNQVQSATPSVDRDDNAPSSTQGSDIIEQVNAQESDKAIKESNGSIATDAQDLLLTSYHIESNGESDYPGMFVVKPPVNNAEPAENSISPLQHDGLKLIVPPNVGSLVIDNSQMNQELDVTVQMNNPGSGQKGRTNLSFSPPASVLGQSNLGGQMNNLELPTNLAINGKEQKVDKDKVQSIGTVPEISHQHTVQNNVEIHLEEPLKVNKDVLTDKQIKLVEDLKDIERIKGKDMIITVESNQISASSLQRSPDILESGTCVAEQGGVTTETGGRRLDIVKSIVYGGLIESVASLSVVSSAAAADAATVNVLALGLANIFGGLFVISHDLWDLKSERTRGSSDEAPEQEDRYQQLLGQRADFALHMIVSLLSYLVFGFLPPVVYGFSFHESNNKDLKLLMVAAASMVCIITLAAGKAYVQRPHKSYFKTICYYVVFGIMVSGVSYLFGGLIMMLLEKIDSKLSVRGVSSEPGLASY